MVYPEIAKEQKIACGTIGTIPLKTVLSIPSDDLYLLGVLNSEPAWEYLKNVCSILGDAERGGRLTLQTICVSKLPIPHAFDADKAAFTALAQKCLDAERVGCEAR